MFCGGLKDLPYFLKLIHENARQLLLDSPHGIEVTIEKKKTKRSNAQNAYYWIVNSEISDFLNDSGCAYGEYQIPYTKDIIHDINKKLFGVVTTTKLEVKDFCDYMTKVLSFWIEKTNGCFEVSELPQSYLIKHGFSEDYFK